MQENKFKKDVADPMPNIKMLEDVFEVDTSTGEVLNSDDIKSEVSEMRKELKDIEDNLPDVDQIILDNIERANRFLDKLEVSIMAGNMSATMMESCATLINAVTSAATSITGISYNNDVIEIRKGELAVREKKLAIETVKGNTPTQVTGDVNIINNNLTMTREELLKELKAG